MAVPDGHQTSRGRRRLALALWSVTTLAAWGVAWFTYTIFFWVNSCLLGTARGGRAHAWGGPASSVSFLC